MKIPNFSPGQFVDATLFNAAMANQAVNFDAVASMAGRSGLVRPDAATITAAGLVVTSLLPSPFAVLFENGVLASAHGTQSNADTSTYSTDFTSLVPVSGASVVSYLLATVTSIQQQPVQVIGPPAGHPDYDPSFVPYTAYVAVVDSLSLSAGIVPPDNSTTFELARATLVSGAVSMVLNFSNQQRAFGNGQTPCVLVSGAVGLSSAYGGKNIVAVAAAAITLPDCAKSSGLEFSIFSATSGVVSVLALGSDVIYGLPSAPATSGVSVTLDPRAFACFTSYGSAWGIEGATPVSGTTTRYGQLKLATAAETITGTDDTKAVTPADFAAAFAAGSVFSKSFQSGQLSVPTTAGTQSAAHGLGVLPTLYSAYLINISSDLGYSAGDCVPVGWTSTSVNSNDRDAQFFFNTTTIGVLVGANQGIGVFDKSTHVYAFVDTTKWKLVLSAWA